MNTRVNRYLKIMFLGYISLSVQCASTEEDESNFDELSNDNFTINGENTGNNFANSNFANESGANNFGDSEFENNASTDEFADDFAIQNEGINNSMFDEFEYDDGLNFGNNSLAGNSNSNLLAASNNVANPNLMPVENLSSNLAPETNIAAVNSAPEAIEQEVMANIVTDAPVIDTGVPSTASSAKVRYVLQLTSLYTEPNGTTAAGSLEKGDHPLVVNETNGFSQIDSGLFLPSTSLTDQAVGRSMRVNVWGSQQNRM